MNHILYKFHKKEEKEALSELESMESNNNQDYKNVNRLRSRYGRELNENDILTPGEREVCDIYKRYHYNEEKRIYYGKYLVDKKKIQDIFNMPEGRAKDILIHNFKDYEEEYYSDLDFELWKKDMKAKNDLELLR